MPAAWNRGQSSARPTEFRARPTEFSARSGAPFRRSVRLGNAARPVALALAVAALVFAGCDNPTSIADKQAGKAMESASMPPKRSTAIDAPVAAAIGAEPLSEQAKVGITESLPTLGKLDSQEKVSTEGDLTPLSAWRYAEANLTSRQRQAIATAMRQAALADHKPVRDALLAAAQTANASPDVAIDPFLRLADLEVVAGDAIARNAADIEVELARQVADAQTLLGQLRLNALQIEIYADGSPQKAIESLDQLKGTIAGAGPDADWIGAGPTAIPSDAKVKALIAAAEGEVQRLTADKTDTEQKIQTLRAEGAKLKNEAESQTGQLALDKSVEGAKMIFEAEELFVRTEGLQSRIDAKNQEIAVLKTRQPMIASAQNLVDTRRTSLADRWLGAREQMRALATDTANLLAPAGAADAAAPSPDAPAAAPAIEDEKYLVAPGATTQPSLATSRPVNPQVDLPVINKGQVLALKLARIKALAEQAELVRKEAVDLYRLAEKHIDEAAVKAEAAEKAILATQQQAHPQAGERVAWKARINLLDWTQFTYREAVVQQRLARIAGDRLLSAAIRADLQAELDAKYNLVKASFKAADDVLVSMSNAANEDPKWQADALVKLAGVENPPAGLAELPTKAKDVADLTKQADAEYQKADTLLEDIINNRRPTRPRAQASAGESAPAAAAEDAGASSDAGEVGPDELKTLAGQMKRAARALQVNLLYSRSKMLAMGGDATAAKSKYEAASAAAGRFTRTLYPGRLPAGLGVELAATHAPATKPTIRQPAPQPATPATPPSEGGNNMFNPDGTPVTPPTTPGTPGAPAAVPPAPANWPTHSVADSGISFSTPPDWVVDEALPPGANAKMNAPTNDGTTVVVMVIPGAPEGTAEQGMAGFIAAVGQKPDHTVVSSKIADVNGLAGFEVVYDQVNPAGITVRTLAVMAAAPDATYAVTAIAPQTSFTTNEQMFRQIGYSLKRGAAAPGAPATPGTPAAPTDGAAPPATPTPPADPGDGTTPPAPSDGTTPAPSPGV